MFGFLDALGILALIIGVAIGFLGTLTALIIFLIETFWYRTKLRKNIGFKLFKVVMLVSIVFIAFTVIINIILFCIKWVGDYFGMGAWWYW